MNKNIECLMEQATTTHFNEDGSGFHYFHKDRFAELIVRECIDMAESAGLGVDAVEYMKEHFGIE